MKLYQHARSATLANSTFWHSYNFCSGKLYGKKIAKLQPALKLLFLPLLSKFLYTRCVNMCEILLPHFSQKQCFNVMARAVTPVPTSRPLSCSDVLARFYGSLIVHCSQPADATGASLWPLTKCKKVRKGISIKKGIATKFQPKFAGEGSVQSSPSKPHQSLIVSLNANAPANATASPDANAPANATAPPNANASLTLHPRILIHHQTSEHHQMLTPSTNADTSFHISASLNDNASANVTSKKAHKHF